MKLYKYIHVEGDGATVPVEFDYKEPFVWSGIPPGDDYTEVEGLELQSKMISREKSGYPERLKIGIDYADYMNARLIVLRKLLLSNGLPLELVKTIVRALRLLTESTRVQISSGLWVSAEDEADTMITDNNLQALITQYTLPIDQAEIISEIKAKIQKSLMDLY